MHEHYFLIVFKCSGGGRLCEENVGLRLCPTCRVYVGVPAILILQVATSKTLIGGWHCKINALGRTAVKYPQTSFSHIRQASPGFPPTGTLGITCLLILRQKVLWEIWKWSHFGSWCRNPPSLSDKDHRELVLLEHSTLPTISGFGWSFSFPHVVLLHLHQQDGSAGMRAVVVWDWPIFFQCFWGSPHSSTIGMPSRCKGLEILAMVGREDKLQHVERFLIMGQRHQHPTGNSLPSGVCWPTSSSEAVEELLFG